MPSILDTPRPRLLLTLFCLLLWAPGFFTLPPGDRDESRFAQATKQMLETGDFVQIMNGTEARNRKPIGIHWLQAPFAAAAHAAGVATANPIWPYRIPSALGGLVAVLACFTLGRRLVGHRAALLAAAILAASVILVTEVHIAKTDAALLGVTTVVMGLLAAAYLDPTRITPRLAATFWLAIGGGILLKGPITPMIAALAVITLVALDRKAAWLRVLRPAWGIPLMLAVILPWFVAIGQATHGRFFADAVGGDLGRKLTSGDDAHGGPPGLHLVLLAALLFPATALLPAGLSAAWRDRSQPEIRFLLAWIIPAWFVFEVTPTKLPHYTLPLYPAICLLLARALIPPPGRFRQLGPILAALGATLIGAAALAAPWILQMGPGSTLLLGVPTLAAAALTGWFAAQNTGPALIRALLAAPLLYTAALGWELPSLTPIWLSPRILDAARPYLSPAAPTANLGAVGYAEPSLMFLAGSNTQWLKPSEAAAALATGQVDAIAVGGRDLRIVEAEADRLGIPLQRHTETTGFNYSRGRGTTLTILTR